MHAIDRAPLTFAQTKPPLRDCRAPTYVVIMGLRVTLSIERIAAFRLR